MNFTSLIQQIKRLIALWIFEALTHEDPKQPTYDPDLFDFEEFTLTDEELENLEDLPPPPDNTETSATAPATNLLPIYIKLPARIQEEQLDELLLPYAITDPDKAEALRWDILASIGISRDLGATPVDAWLAKTKELSNDNPWITLRGLAAQNLTRRTRNWILWLVGVEHPAPPDKQ